MPAPVAAGNVALDDAATATLPCPCGRSFALTDCCLPIAEHLRRGSSGNPTPFDEIRASSSLLLWSLLATELPSTSVIRALSRAAHRFWGPIVARTYGNAAIGDPNARPEAPESAGEVLRIASAREPDSDNPFDVLMRRAESRLSN